MTLCSKEAASVRRDLLGLLGLLKAGPIAPSCPDHWQFLASRYGAQCRANMHHKLVDELLSPGASGARTNVGATCCFCACLLCASICEPPSSPHNTAQQSHGGRPHPARSRRQQHMSLELSCMLAVDQLMLREPSAGACRQACSCESTSLSIGAYSFKSTQTAARALHMYFSVVISCCEFLSAKWSKLTWTPF